MGFSGLSMSHELYCGAPDLYYESLTVLVLDFTYERIGYSKIFRGRPSEGLATLSVLGEEIAKDWIL